jgi:hypothetical protein
MLSRYSLPGDRAKRPSAGTNKIPAGAISGRNVSLAAALRCAAVGLAIILVVPTPVLMMPTPPRFSRRRSVLILIGIIRVIVLVRVVLGVGRRGSGADRQYPGRDKDPGHQCASDAATLEACRHVTLLPFPCFTLIIYTERMRFVPGMIPQKLDPTSACMAGTFGNRQTYLLVIGAI